MPNTTRDYVKAMVNAMDSKRGEDIQVLKVADLTSIAEYFVICSATSTTQVKTLADEVEFKLKTDYEVMPHHVEGHDSASWRRHARSTAWKSCGRMRLPFRWKSCKYCIFFRIDQIVRWEP